MVPAPTQEALERELGDRRFAAQLLVGEPARGVVELSTDCWPCRPRTCVLLGSPFGRTVGLAAADVDRELDNRALVVTWLNRGTLHLVRSND